MSLRTTKRLAELVGILLTAAFGLMLAGDKQIRPVGPLFRTVELNVGESQNIELSNGKTVGIKVLHLEEVRDELCSAVRSARVTVEVNGETDTLTSATYHLPVTVGGVQIDCPITKGYLRDSEIDSWGLAKDVRLRLWPAGSPWIPPDRFVYPVRQHWFASATQMANEPVFVDGGDIPGHRKIYYHYGLDIGGSEGRVDVVSATDGSVVSSGLDVLQGHKDTPVDPRYDVVYLIDAQGWYYRYSHLKTIDAAVRPGKSVRMGQKIGVLGKEGGSAVAGPIRTSTSIVGSPRENGVFRKVMRSSGRRTCISMLPGSRRSLGRII